MAGQPGTHVRFLLHSESSVETLPPFRLISGGDPPQVTRAVGQALLSRSDRFSPALFQTWPQSSLFEKAPHPGFSPRMEQGAELAAVPVSIDMRKWHTPG